MKKQKKSSKSGRFLTILFSFVLFIGIMIAFTPIFTINSIEVIGNEYYTTEDILAQTSVSVGENGFKFLKLDVSSVFNLRFISEENIINKLPRVNYTVIRYILPDKVEINIYERKGVACLKHLGNNLLIDAEGYIIDNIGDEHKNSYIEIRGADFSRYVLGEKLVTSPVDLIDTIVGLLGAVQKSDSRTERDIFDIMDWIDIRKPEQLVLSLDDRLTVKLGNMAEIAYKIDFLKQIYFGNIRENERGMIDFTKGENPSFIPEN